MNTVRRACQFWRLRWVLVLVLVSAACSSDGANVDDELPAPATSAATADFPYPIGAEQPDDASDDVRTLDNEAVDLSEAITAAGDVSGLLTKPVVGTFCGLRQNGEGECWGADTSLLSDPNGTFVTIGAGRGGVCGLRESGEVDCWGPLFLSSGSTRASAGSFAAISAGGFQTCGLRSSGSVECWGISMEQFLEGAVPSTPDVAYPNGEFTSVSVGGAHVCGLRASSEAECWGTNWFGQTDAASGPFAAVDAGQSHSCGLRSDGSVSCWGEEALDAAELNGRGITFVGDEAAYGAAPPYPRWPYMVFPSLKSFLDLEGAVPELEVREEMVRRAQGWVLPGGPFVSVSAGYGFTCGLRVDGEVDCWGYFAREEPRIPLEVYAEVYGPRLWDFYNTTKAQLTDGDDQSFDPRFNSLYESLYGTRVWELDPTKKLILGLDARLLETMVAPLRLVDPPPGPFIAVKAGWDRACGLRPDGDIECWGAEYEGDAPPPGPFATAPITTQ